MPKNKTGEPYRKTARWNGKKYEATGRTELEALTRLADKIAAAKRGEEALNGSMTVNAWYKEWKATYKDPKGLTPKSLGMYDEKYNGYIKPAVGHMKLQSVKDIHLQRILNGQAGMSRSHVEKLRRVMRELFRRARQSRLIAYDPSEDLQLPEHRQGSHRSLTPEEREVLLTVCTRPDSRFGLYFLTLLYTGMRPGEAAALNWADIDFANNEIHVHAALESGTSRIKAPKSAAGVRDIPIHASLLPRLKSAQKGPFDPVFIGAGGQRLTRSAMDAMWRACKRAMDLELGAETVRNQIQEHKVAADLTPYCLRHTFCTDLQAAGVPINIAKDLMGHSDIDITANIYTHRDGSTLHAGIALLDGTAGKKKWRLVGHPVGQMSKNLLSLSISSVGYYSQFCSPS